MRKPFNGNYILTQGFGVNKPNYVKFGLEGHNGLDYSLPTSTEVLAPHSGKVIEATNDPSGYGNYIKIENDKEGSVTAHLQDFKVKVGDTVTEGQLIAHSDNTGNSTGPHLHWGYYAFPRNRQNGFAGFIDQLPLLNPASPPITTLPIPNPGYAPTFENQTVSKDGITYQSYKQNGQLLWKIQQIPTQDFKALYEQAKKEKDQMQTEFDNTKVSLSQAQDRIKVLEKIIPADPRKDQALIDIQKILNLL